MKKSDSFDDFWRRPAKFSRLLDNVMKANLINLLVRRLSRHLGGSSHLHVTVRDEEEAEKVSL